MQSGWEEEPWSENGFYRDRIEETGRNGAQLTRCHAGQNLGFYLLITMSR